MYINFMLDENKDVYIYFWLLLITLLVALMIVIDGLTRLTDSGLSITNWDLFSGIIPPLNRNEWEHFFSLYKEIPEYKLIKKEGPSHSPTFTVSLKVLKFKLIKATGESKRQAEKNAAKIALNIIDEKKIN